MSKFKFGDKVIINGEVDVKGVVVDVITTNTGQDIVQVYEIHQDEELEMEFTVVNDRKPEELELIPHPDTVRLDFLIKHGAYIEAADGTYGFYVNNGHDICSNQSRMREVLDMVIDKKAKG